MKQIYKPEQKRIYNQRFWKRMKKKGWKNYSWYLPLSVGEQVASYKDTLMKDYDDKTTT